jgi:hypothetical protein
MSYCAFKNTSAAMNQIAGMLDEAIQNRQPLELNDFEIRYYRSMHDKCSSLMELLEQHEELAAEVNEKEEEESA